MGVLCSQAYRFSKNQANLFRTLHRRSINGYRSRHQYTRELHTSRKLTIKAQEFADTLARKQISIANVYHDPWLTPTQAIIGENIFIDQVPKSEIESNRYFIYLGKKAAKE